MVTTIKARRGSSIRSSNPSNPSIPAKVHHINRLSTKLFSTPSDAVPNSLPNSHTSASLLRGRNAHDPPHPSTWMARVLYLVWAPLCRSTTKCAPSNPDGKSSSKRVKIPTDLSGFKRAKRDLVRSPHQIWPHWPKTRGKHVFILFRRERYGEKTGEEVRSSPATAHRVKPFRLTRRPPCAARNEMQSTIESFQIPNYLPASSNSRPHPCDQAMPPVTHLFLICIWQPRRSQLHIFTQSSTLHKYNYFTCDA